MMVFTKCEDNAWIVLTLASGDRNEKHEIIKIMRKMHVERRKSSFLKDQKIRNFFSEKVIEMDETWDPELLGHFMDVDVGACHAVCGKMSGMRSKGDTLGEMR